MTTPLRLHVQGLTKSFGPVSVLTGIDLEVAPGEIHAICGENGAGKSTLIKCLSGVYPNGSYGGTISVEGQEARFSNTKDAEKAGIGVIHQELLQIADMTVAENFALGAWPTRRGIVDWDKVYEDARRAVEKASISLDVSAKIQDLGIGRRQLAEIAKAVGKESRVLILDEPTAALTEVEVEHLLNLLRRYRSEGISCIYVSHKLDEVFAVADRITVLRAGRTVATGVTSEWTKRKLIYVMANGVPEEPSAAVGRDGRVAPKLAEDEAPSPRRTSPLGKSLLRIRGLNVSLKKKAPPVLREIAFEVRAGEVLGVGGLMGAGRTELLMHLFGAFGYRLSGEVELLGEKVAPLSPQQNIEKGMVLVSEDRKRYGLVLEQTIGEQLVLSSLHRYKKLGLLDHDRMIQDAQTMFKSVAVALKDDTKRGIDVVVGTLSGGNQQKVVLGKALLTGPQVLLLDEPTRGIDPTARSQVYELINRLTAEGKAVVLVSSDMEELRGMSDRIVVLREGEVAGEFPAGTAANVILEAAAGASSEPGDHHSPTTPVEVRP
jgi:D-xylose transport system ATP-binding protein